MKHIYILLLFVSVSTFGQVTGRFNNILLPAGTTTVTIDKIYNTSHDLYWNGEKISNWKTNGNSHIEPWPSTKKIYYPGMPSAAGQTLPSHYTPVYFNRYNNEFTTFLVNGGGGGQITDDDTLTGCQGVYNYSVDGQDVTIDIDSIYNICGCFYFLVTGENTTVTLQSIEGLLVGGTQTYTVTTGQNILICPDTTEFLVSSETDPIYSADSGAIKDTLDAHNLRINALVNSLTFVVDTLNSLTKDTAFADLIPAGWLIKNIVFYNDSKTGQISCGTTAGKNDVFGAMTVSKAGLTTIEVEQIYSYSLATSLYFNHASLGDTWNSMICNAYVTREYTLKGITTPDLWILRTGLWDDTWIWDDRKVWID